MPHVYINRTYWTATLVPIESSAQRIPKFPKVKPHAPNTMQTPSRESLSLAGRMKQSFWALGARLKEPDLKYAFKAGVATAMLAAPAFYDATRPWFVEYRGEWALVSVCLVCDSDDHVLTCRSDVRRVSFLLSSVPSLARLISSLCNVSWVPFLVPSLPLARI